MKKICNVIATLALAVLMSSCLQVYVNNHEDPSDGVTNGTTDDSVEPAEPSISFVIGEDGGATLEVISSDGSNASIYWTSVPYAEMENEDVAMEYAEPFEGTIFFDREHVPAVRTIFMAYSMMDGVRSSVARYDYTPRVQPDPGAGPDAEGLEEEEPEV